MYGNGNVLNSHCEWNRSVAGNIIKTHWLGRLNRFKSSDVVFKYCLHNVTVLTALGVNMVLYNELYLFCLLLSLGVVAPGHWGVRHEVHSYFKQYIPKGTLTNRRGPAGLTQNYILHAFIVYLKDMAALFSKHCGCYMTLCRHTAWRVIHPEANNGMFCDKQRFPVVHRGANGCLYWSQVYVMY